MTDSTRRRAFLAATGTAIALAGCLDDAGTSGQDGDGTADEGDDEEPDVEWREATLEDVTTGEEFAIAELDRPVVIHTFAPFCPTCNDHQDRVTDEYETVSDDLELLDLAVDGNDDPETIREHAEDNGHEWRFGIAPEPFTRSLVEEFGQEVAIHAQSPLIIVCPDGSAEAIDKPASISTIRSAVNSAC